MRMQCSAIGVCGGLGKGKGEGGKGEGEGGKGLGGGQTVLHDIIYPSDVM